MIILDAGGVMQVITTNSMTLAVDNVTTPTG